MIVRRHFFRRLCGGVLAAVFAPMAVLAETTNQRKKRRPAQDPSAVSSPTPEESPSASAAPEESPAAKSNVAQVRLWKTSEKPDLTLQLRFLPYGKPASEALSPFKIEADSYQFTDYTEIPSGPMTVEISAPQKTSVILPLHLSAKSLSTLLVRSAGTTLTADWIDDTPGGPETPHEFTVYNLLPSSSADVQVDLGSLLSAHLVSARSSVLLSGMKRAVYSVAISGVDGTGKSIRWNTEVDFRQYRRATLLIYPDAYGRIRPRITPA